MKPDKVKFVSILKACGSSRALAEGKGMHHGIITRGFEPDIVIKNTLIDMYAKCGSLEDAYYVFEKVQNRDEVSWGVMISGYARHGHGFCALELFEEMQQEGIKPNKVNILCILNVCASIGALLQGRAVHEHIVKSCLEPNLIINNCLIDMYAKCENLDDAQDVFDELPHRDVISWGSLIGGYATLGYGFHALELFEKMQQDGIMPNRVIFLCILKACGSIGSVAYSRLVHSNIIRCGLAYDIRVENTLIDMYAKCGKLDEAHNVFDKLPIKDVVSWGSMISGFAMHGQGSLAFDVYQKMHEEGILPNEIIFLGIIKSCDGVETLAQGRCAHDHIIRGGLESTVTVGNALVDMYSKFGSLEEASNVFLGLTNHDAVTWGAMIATYVACEYDLCALEVYKKMQEEGCVPNIGTFSFILKACGSIGSVRQGRFIHDQVIRSGLEIDMIIGNNLVDMYTKCGSIEEACEVFDHLQILDEVSWGAMVARYAMHGDWRFVGQCLNEVQEQGLNPGLVAFTRILASCSNAGLIHEGCRYFKSMREDYGICPSIEHYSCMVDLLGRSGFLNEAKDILHTMHIPPDAVIWRSLLTNSKTYGNEELGRGCFEEALQSNPWDASGYVLISNIYADVDM